MGLFSSSSKSSNTTNITDQRIGADAGENSYAFRADGSGNVVTVGSDDVAQFAIESSTKTLEQSTEFIGKALTDFFNVTDRSQEMAYNNIAANQQLTSELLQKNQESSDDRLIGVYQWAVIGILGFVLIQSGSLKGTFK
tara:strand:+ start:241 stop:657 length:417 start_codon:yes stop_codon:yes gene_type:complete